MNDIKIIVIYPSIWGFPGGSVVKNLPAMQDTACNEGEVGSIPQPERSLREVNGI